MTLDSLVASRLCHDLVSPLGAIGNGLELLRMQYPASEELDLIEEAVKGAQSRIDLFRIAFGQASDDQIIDAAQLERALKALGSGRPIAVHMDLCTSSLARPLARRLALAALCAETAMAWGGSLQITAELIDAEAPRLRALDAHWDALSRGHLSDTLDGATVHFGLLAHAGVSGVEHGPNRIVIRL